MVLFERANKRKRQEYLMQIAIAQNPHVKNPQDLIRALSDKQEDYIEEQKLDKAAFAIFKQRISENPRIIVK